MDQIKKLNKQIKSLTMQIESLIRQNQALIQNQNKIIRLIKANDLDKECFIVNVKDKEFVKRFGEDLEEIEEIKENE